MNLFSIAFLLALAVATLTRLWLTYRHVQHIQAHRTAVPTAFANDIALDAHQKAADYNGAKGRLALIHTIVDSGVLLVLTFGGLLQFLDAWAGSWFASDLRGTALIALFAVVVRHRFPFSWYRAQHRRSLRLQSDDARHVDRGPADCRLGRRLRLPLVLAVLWLMGKMGQWWWLYVWLVWVTFSLFMMAIYPAYIAPLFNKFAPMPDSSLKKRIENLLAKCGFRSNGLFVMDGSKRSSHGNAYFTGFGKTKRIVFFDTLISRLSEDEIEAVLAHELGHFKLRHVIRRMLWTFGVSLLLLGVLGYLKDKAWFYEGLGVAYPATNAMALLLFMLVLPVFTFLLQPLVAMYSRRHEFEADAYAARYSSPRELVNALVKLYKDNASTLTPDPLHSAFYDSHPPASARIARLQSLGAP
jgi:STE24 endopeptidase